MRSLGFVALLLLIIGGINLGLQPLIDKFWIAYVFRPPLRFSPTNAPLAEGASRSSERRSQRLSGTLAHP